MFHKLANESIIIVWDLDATFNYNFGHIRSQQHYYGEFVPDFLIGFIYNIWLFLLLFDIFVY